jgi:hypothetical protein
MFFRSFLIVTVLFASSALATPLTYYFPDQPIGVIEAKDLQEAVAQTGSFGEDTQKLLGILLNEGLKSELGSEINVPGPLKDLTVRTLIGSVRDVAVALYSVGNSADFLGVIRMTPKNPIVGSFTNAFNSAVKSARPNRKFREGNYLATVDSGFAAGIGNNLFYFSSNADLLRAYLRRVNGATLPLLPNNTTYRAALEGTGDGFFKGMVNYAALAKYLERTKDSSATPRVITALKTLNFGASASTIVADGLETRGVTQLNPNGGDAALYKLLTYVPDNLELLQSLPSTAKSASVIATDTVGWLEYLKGWLPEVGFSGRDGKQIIDVFEQLKTRLGNEWGMVNTNLPDSTGLGSVAERSFYSPIGIGISALGSALNPGPDVLYYAKTPDGNLVLNDLETALKAALVDDPKRQATDVNGVVTVERVEIAGFDTVAVKQEFPANSKQIGQNLFIVNKDDTIVIGSDQTNLELHLSASPLADDPAFQALGLPAGLTGVQYIAPVRLERDEIDAIIAQSMKAYGFEKDVPQAMVTALADWLESWALRTEVSSTQFSVDGNKLRSYGKTGFAWNR